ncbi:daptide-type RiPP [Nocardiopsis sp. FIRDI 009]|uniref:daptide-type RiPP n=1 Tax=Nocardiopsis sp. FIRDI 009 TaxID=714197 RepID=UPI0018E4F01E|nr:daptide-type RiPP [Nocardiopsis sp. FIRDI 009]
MSDEKTAAANPAENTNVELEMQELEPLEAPGFWTGVGVGTVISASVATSVAVT